MTEQGLREKIAFQEYIWAHPFELLETLTAWWAETKETSLQDLVTYYYKATQILALIKEAGWKSPEEPEKMIMASSGILHPESDFEKTRPEPAVERSNRLLTDAQIDDAMFSLSGRDTASPRWFCGDVRLRAIAKAQLAKDQAREQATMERIKEECEAWLTPLQLAYPRWQAFWKEVLGK